MRKHSEHLKFGNRGGYRFHHIIGPKSLRPPEAPARTARGDILRTLAGSDTRVGSGACGLFAQLGLRGSSAFLAVSGLYR